MGSATGIAKEPVIPIILLGDIIFAGLITYIFTQWAQISTFAGGAKAGAVIGLMAYLAFNLISLGTANVHTWPSAIVGGICYGVITAITGGVIGTVLQKMPKS